LRWHSKNAIKTKNILEGTAKGWEEKFPETVEKYRYLNEEPNFEKTAGALLKMWMDQTEIGYPNENIKGITCP
jgi:hypothetical protein